MSSFGSYCRLMRLDKPVGTLLLWFPTLWGLWLANDGSPPQRLLLLFFLGTLIMRSAGCVMNDIVDRNIDKYVKRTTSRPLASGELKLPNAILLLGILLCMACWILIQLPIACFLPALFSVTVTFIYPFCKRFFKAPQLVLSIAFSMGIPMAYIASEQSMDLKTCVLWLSTLSWIVAYDTMYAMADREDDLKLGVQSTAILFGRWDVLIIMIFQLTMYFSWLYFIGDHVWQRLLWYSGFLLLIYQWSLIRTRQPQACFRAFISNMWLGIILCLVLVLK